MTCSKSYFKICLILCTKYKWKQNEQNHMQKSILDDIETHNDSISRLLGKELTKNSF